MARSNTQLKWYGPSFGGDGRLVISTPRLADIYVYARTPEEADALEDAAQLVMAQEHVGTPEALKPFGLRAQWGHEATDTVTGDMLFTSVTYNHSTRGTWKAVLVHRDGSATKLARVPNINGRKWAVTENGASILFEGRE